MALKANREQTVDVSGALVFDSVAAVYQESRDILTARISTINLAEVTAVDSSGLALLLEWQSEAARRGQKLAFVNAPSDLQRLAALSEATGLLGLPPRNEPDGAN